MQYTVETLGIDGWYMTREQAVLAARKLLSAGRGPVVVRHSTPDGDSRIVWDSRDEDPVDD